MKKFNIIFAVIFSFVFISFAQSKNDKINAQKNGKEFLEAQQSFNLNLFLKNTYLPFWEQIKGERKENLGQIFQYEFKILGELGYQYENLKVGDLKEIKEENGNWQCVIPYSVVEKITTQNRKIETKSGIWGISLDKGKTWQFLNLASFDQNKMGSFLPILNTKLQLPILEQKRLD
jgi:hypothetical protein